MKKRFILSIVLILAVLFSSFAYATENTDVMPNNADEGAAIPEEWRRTGTVETPATNMLSNTQYIFEENANLQDVEVDGNIFAFGTNLSLTNVVVHGDVFIAGQNITFSNLTVNGTVFVAGETINMNDVNISGNLFNASETINLKGTAKDAYIAAANLTINDGSMISRELFASAEQVDFVGGQVGKNAYISADELTIGSTAGIAGTLNYSSEEEAEISSDSIIGDVNFNKVEIEVEENVPKTGAKVYNAVVIAIKSIFICGFIFLFAKGFMEKQKSESVGGYFVKNTLKGLAWTVVIPIVFMMLLCTGVTVGLSFVVLAIYIIIFWMSVPIVAVAITANIDTKQENIWRTYGYAVLISIAIALLKQIPTLGGIITFVVGIAAMGIVMSSLKNKKNNNTKIEAEVVE